MRAKRGRGPTVALVDIYTRWDRFYLQLYQLLAERTPEQSISHKRMPTMAEHKAFVDGRPYAHWYEIRVDGKSVGAIYLSDRREIGVSIFHQHQRKGYGRAAVLELMHLHPGPMLANVNPANAASRALWESLGGELLQVTYEIPVYRG
ncbi:MAG: GNAT family N-acetyltransferase [Candidatus Nanopelagicales bacterium]